MLIRILCLFVCFLSFSVVSVSNPGVSLGGPALAGEGGGGGQDPAASNAPKDKSSTTKAQKEKDKAVRGSLRAIELTLNAIERSAKNNKLRSILRSKRRVTSLQVGIDTMYDELDGTKHQNKPQAIYDKLNEYARQKNDPELRQNARDLLQAIAASRQFGRALDAREAYKKAKKAQDYNEMAKQQNEYEDARSEFHRKADKMTRSVRNKLFFKLPREIE